jgi:hypothetical protein
MSFNGLIQFSMTEKRIALIKQFERSWGGYFSFTLALIDDRWKMKKANGPGHSTSSQNTALPSNVWAFDWQNKNFVLSLVFRFTNVLEFTNNELNVLIQLANPQWDLSFMITSNDYVPLYHGPPKHTDKLWPFLIKYWCRKVKNINNSFTLVSTRVTQVLM